ncbi:MAG: PAS domain S-box protein, partial [Proteobacteria bacterium]|nr:PAS domain S-box protein [Pseudomonadota bacterium]
MVLFGLWETGRWQKEFGSRFFDEMMTDPDIGVSITVILLDYDLGATTGLDMLSKIGDIPVVFVTGKGSEEIAVAAMRAGAYDYLIKDSERNYLKVLPLTIQNVLRRKGAEDELLVSQQNLETSQKLLDSIVKSVPEIIYRLDGEANITFISDSITHYGYQPEELVGKSMFDIVHPEDAEKVVFRINERREGEREVGSFEVRLMTKEKATVLFEVFSISAVGLYESNDLESRTFVGTQGVARDIADKNRAYSQRWRGLKNPLTIRPISSEDSRIPLFVQVRRTIKTPP